MGVDVKRYIKTQVHLPLNSIIVWNVIHFYNFNLIHNTFLMEQSKSNVQININKSFFMRNVSKRFSSKTIIV